jgi:hypothetical protein
MREVGVTRLLDQRYGRMSMGVHRYVRAPQVRDRPGWATRICDYMALDTYQAHDGDWSVRYAIHGHEIKVSRSDWLAELRDPGKAEAFRPYCSHWWLVVSDASIVRDDLPDGWGLLVAQGSRLVAKRKVPAVEPAPMPRHMLSALARAVASHAIALAPDRSRPGLGTAGVTGAQPDEPASQAGRPVAGGGS